MLINTLMNTFMFDGEMIVGGEFIDPVALILLILAIFAGIFAFIFVFGVLKGKKRPYDYVDPTCDIKRINMGRGFNFLKRSMHFWTRTAFGWEFIGTSEKPRSAYNDGGEMLDFSQKMYYFARQKGYSRNPIFWLAEMLARLALWLRPLIFKLTVVAFALFFVCSTDVLPLPADLALKATVYCAFAYVAAIVLNVLAICVAYACRAISSRAEKLTDEQKTKAKKKKEKFEARDDREYEKEYEKNVVAAAEQKERAQQERAQKAWEEALADLQREEAALQQQYKDALASGRPGYYDFDTYAYQTANKRLREMAIESGMQEIANDLEEDSASAEDMKYNLTKAQREIDWTNNK